MESGSDTVRFHDFATGKSPKVFTTAKRMFPGLSLSPYGRYLLYSLVDNEGSELMLVENFR